MNRAIRRVGLAVTVLMLGLVAQLSYLQIVDARNLKDDPRNVRTQIRDFNRDRGLILTSDGEVVARSVEVDDPQFKFQREYPFGSLFGHISGYQSFIFGNTGVEAVYNDVMIGRDTQLQLGNLGDLLLSGKQATGNVVLTLSAAAQTAARDALGDRRGSVVALDPATGEILAMYSNPSYDPQTLASLEAGVAQTAFDALNADPANPALPRAWREIYPPGSTYKAVTTAVGLETGITTPETTYPTLSELTLPLTTSTIQNFNGSTCGGTLEQSFVKSCNTTFAQIGLDLAELFPPGDEQFGIGSAPPLDENPKPVASTGPRSGTFATDAPAFARAGIGQAPVAVTPLQMALVAAAIANDGVMMEPHVLGRVTDNDEQVIRNAEPEPWRTATTPAVAATVTDLMLQVVEGGTGTSARIDGVAVAGKTGTAQNEDAKGNPRPPHAWFIAFAPAEAPRVAIAVLVENGGTGGSVAAPIARQVIQVLLGLPVG